MSGSCLQISFWTFFILQALKDAVLPESVNVALNKRGTKCREKEDVDGKLFDGLLEVGVVLNIEACSSPTIEIYLGDNYLLSHIVIYSSEGNDKQLDEYHTRATYADGGDSFSENGVFPDAALPYRPSRVNVEHSLKSAKTVQILLKKSSYVNITEIEVYSFDALGSHMPRGCFDNVITSQTLRGVNCIEHCFKMKKIFAAMMGDFCACMDKLPAVELSPSKCYHKCRGEGYRFCGGMRSASVYYTYIPLPHFDYCYKFGEEWLNNTGENEITGNITVEHCLQHCEKYHFAIIYSGNTCSCEYLNETRDGTLSYKYGITPEDRNSEKCNMSCSGDPDERCGGNLHFSLYKTCQGDPYSDINCSALFHCIGPYDKNGVCIGGCQPGFFGEHCLERDLDECILKPCEIENSECQNTQGSYTCNCKSGFQRSSLGECLAAEKEEEISIFRRLLSALFYIIFVGLLVGAAYYVNKNKLYAKLLKPPQEAAKP